MKKTSHKLSAFGNKKKLGTLKWTLEYRTSADFDGGGKKNEGISAYILFIDRKGPSYMSWFFPSAPIDWRL